MRPTIKTDIRNFSDMVRDIARRSGRALPEVVDAEAAGVLRTMVKRTKAAKVSQIVKRNESREFRTYRGKKYLMHGTGKHGHTNRYPDLIWAQLLSLQRASIARAVKRRGLAKQSWLQIARALGLVIAAPGYVSKALSPVTGAGRRIRGGLFRSYVVELRNFSLVVARHLGGAALLGRVMRGRVAQYRRAIKEQLRQVARTAARGRGAVVS